MSGAVCSSNYSTAVLTPRHSYAQCTCCPYGYHIDLDFVRFCESLAAGPPRVQTPSQLKRRERRRQRQSMEVMLGIAPSIEEINIDHEQADEDSCWSQSQHNTQSIQSPLWSTFLSTQSRGSLTGDSAKNGLQEAVLDFERTFEQSSGHNHSRTSNDLDTASSSNRLGIRSNRSIGESGPVLDDDEDGAASNSSELSTCALQNIREQMAMSLNRMREMEDQVKIIPMLQMQLSVLKEEKRQLQSQINYEEPQSAPLRSITSHRVSPISLNSLSQRGRSNSLTESARLAKCPARDVGTMCVAITREVGISPQQTRHRSFGVGTDEPLISALKLQRSLTTQTSLYMSSIRTDRDLDKLREVINMERTKPAKVSVGTQMFIQNKTPNRKDASTQSVEVQKPRVSMGVSAHPHCKDVSTEAKPHSRSVRSGDFDITVTCEKCKVRKKSIAVGPDSEHALVSLSSLIIPAPRSKSFNLGDEKVSKQRRSQSTQSTIINTETKSCQWSFPQATKDTQCSVTTVNKGVQYVLEGVPKYTDTSGLVLLKDSGINTLVPNVVDACCGEAVKPHISISCAENYCDTCKDYIKNLSKEFAGRNQIEVSRIPRPTNLASPVAEHRKFRRQDTYTKIPALKSPIQNCPAESLIRLSALDCKVSGAVELGYTVGIVPHKKCALEPDLDTETEQEESLCKELDDGGRSLNSKENKKDADLFQYVHGKPRQKATPSKEMRAAMKVINDSIQKSPSGRSNHLRNANNIVQQEWFQVSSTISANPLDVEDYLDCFEEISNNLLQYIVNMADISGNTAMHYAVSHGNFDVVSILLDSKVCNINQPNVAGYTSVMLVSLAELRSPSHRTVVRRLLQQADVNIRAKQHGQTALMLAVSHGRSDMVSMLLEAGADINIQDEDGSTALMCAAEHGHADIVKLFLGHHDCDSSIVDMDGSTALKIALEAGNRNIGVLLYAHEHMTRGSSPYTSLRQRRSKASTPTQKSPSTPPSPVALREQDTKLSK